ncbi:hypothetical protein [Candidatus Vidania fulgoroideorum]
MIYRIGDKVIIISGKIKNLIGIIKTIKKEIIIIKNYKNKTVKTNVSNLKTI